MAVLDLKRKLAILSDAADWSPGGLAEAADLRQRLAPAPKQLSPF